LAIVTQKISKENHKSVFSISHVINWSLNGERQLVKNPSFVCNWHCCNIILVKLRDNPRLSLTEIGLELLLELTFCILIVCFCCKVYLHCIIALDLVAGKHTVPDQTSCSTYPGKPAFKCRQHVCDFSTCCGYRTVRITELFRCLIKATQQVCWRCLDCILTPLVVK